MTNPLNEFNAELWNQPTIHKIIARALSYGEGFKFEARHFEAEGGKRLEEWARHIVDQYEGSWDLMVEFRTRQRLGRDLSLNQLKVALNSLLNTWKRSLKYTAAQSILDKPIDFTKVEAEGTQHIVHGTVVTRPIDGFFTVDFGGGWRTLKFETYKGRQYVSYLCGSDNVSDYAKFGYISEDGQLVTWAKAYHKKEKKDYDRSKTEMAVRFVCGLGAGDLLKAGEEFSNKAKLLGSSICCLCGRLLTAPSSVSANIGPHCANKWAERYG